MKLKFSKIIKLVFAAHIAIVCALSLHHFFSKEKPKTKMLVRTFSTQTQTVALTPVKKAAPIAKKIAQSISPAKTSPAVKEKTVAKVNVAPVTSSKSNATPLSDKISPSKTNEIALPKDILPSKTNEIALPKDVATNKIEEIPMTQAMEMPSYGEILTTYLQNSLDLPEYGEVKVDLEIDCYGHLVRIEILEEKSKKNGEFLKKRLPELVLPCFNERGKLHETVVFTITFKNSTSSFQ